MSHVGIHGKSVPGNRNGKCKGTEEKQAWNVQGIVRASVSSSGKNELYSPPSTLLHVLFPLSRTLYINLNL